MWSASITLYQAERLILEDPSPLTKGILVSLHILPPRAAFTSFIPGATPAFKALEGQLPTEALDVTLRPCATKSSQLVLSGHSYRQQRQSSCTVTRASHWPMTSRPVAVVGGVLTANGQPGAQSRCRGRHLSE